MSATDSQVNDAFGGLAQKAEALLESKGLDPGSEPKVETPSAPVAPVVEQPSKAPSPEPTASPLDLSPDTLVKVKVDGQEQVVRYGDFQNDLAGTATFTRRQQALAQQRRELEQQFTQREAELIQAAQWLQAQAQQLQQQGDPVQRLAQALTGGTKPETKPNPNEIVTLGEVQRMLQERDQQHDAKLTEAQQALLQRQQQHLLDAQTEAFIAQERTRFSKSMSSLMDSEDGKMLAEINPQAEAIIRFETMKMGPQDTDQAVEFAQKMAKEWADKVRGKFIQQQKVEAVAAARTKMEPPSGGSPPSPAGSSQKPKSYLKKDGTVDLAAMREQAMALLEQA